MGIVTRSRVPDFALKQGFTDPARCMGRCRGVYAPGFVSMDSTPTRMDTMSSESLQSLIARHQASPHALVQILREAQTLQGWLPREYLVEIAGALGLALAHVQGVAGFTGSSTPDPSAPIGSCSATTSPTACWAMRP